MKQRNPVSDSRSSSSESTPGAAAKKTRRELVTFNHESFEKLPAGRQKSPHSKTVLVEILYLETLQIQDPWPLYFLNSSSFCLY